MIYSHQRVARQKAQAQFPHYSYPDDLSPEAVILPAAFIVKLQTSNAGSLEALLTRYAYG